MANRLNIDLKDKTVVILGEYLDAAYKEAPEHEREFQVEGGFGCGPELSGRALLGYWVADGQRDRVEGYMVEKLAEKQVKGE
jgi:hypothetical protein